MKALLNLHWKVCNEEWYRQKEDKVLAVVNRLSCVHRTYRTQHLVTSEVSPTASLCLFIKSFQRYGFVKRKNKT